MAVTKLDNPAGRLHYWLDAYRSNASEGTMVEATWRQTFGVEAEINLRTELARLAGVIAQLVDSVTQLDDPVQTELLGHHLDKWSEPVLLWRTNMQQTPSLGKNLVDDSAMTVLYTLSALMSATASEGVVPSADERESLLATLSELESEILASQESAQLKTLLLSHISAMRKAVSETLYVGPAAVRAAAESLVGACQIHEQAITDAEDQRRPIVDKTLRVFGMLYVAFTASPALQQSIEAWQDIAKMLPGGH